MNPQAETSEEFDFRQTLRGSFEAFSQTATRQQSEIRLRETGIVTQVERGIAEMEGLPNVLADEVLRFEGNQRGFVFNLERNSVGCVLLDEGEDIQAGMRVERTGRVLDTPVGEELIGRVIDPIGRPLDDRRSLDQLKRMPCERDAPGIMERAPVRTPLQTGLKVVDALIPIGRGQRQLILGDRQTGKSAIALDTIINQRGRDVICIYCTIGQRGTNVARVVSKLREYEAMEHTIVVVGADDAPPGIQFVAPYAATTIGEYFMERGKDVLVVYDDLTAHARAYRHLSLLLRRPPGREAYPGDIFYVHSRLLERSTHLKEESGGGSLTALPVIETEAQNVSAYIPTNLISITDGQIYLSPKLFRKGILPAVDVGRSVSRVGGKTQLPAYRAVAGDLRLTYSQFEEEEKFARFSSQLDEETQRTLQRGQRIRETIKQPQYQPLTVPEQIASLVAVTKGLFDELPTEEIGDVEAEIQQSVTEECSDICDRILSGEKLKSEDLDKIEQTIEDTIAEYRSKHNNAAPQQAERRE